MTSGGRQSVPAMSLVWIEAKFEAERDQLPLWLPVALGAGIACWFLLIRESQWIALIAGGAGLGIGVLTLSPHGRTARSAGLFLLAIALGCALVWWRAAGAEIVPLARPISATFVGRIADVEHLPARESVRLMIEDADDDRLPRRFRVNIDDEGAPAGIERGAWVRLSARLMPPPEASVPGAYDFARRAWFEGIGATGRAWGDVEIVSPVRAGRIPDRIATARARLAAHVADRIGAGAGAIAATLATGDRGRISEDDAEAMRRSGLAHLLSISGLHVTAVIGVVMLIVLKLLALSPRLALRKPLILIAASAGAVAGIAYTIFTGGEVPTVRACVAALLVLVGLALGRDAITLRLIATGAIVVLLVWPETLAGPSFQLSFAAVTAIVALHENPRVRRLLSRRDEPWSAKIGRFGLGLLLTGVVVEIALMPIALFHFHKAGLYGALANIVAIPLTSFVIIPLEVLGLLLDTVGLGKPVWLLVGGALDLLLAIAHRIADAPGSVALLPAMPGGAFGLMVGGGLWICLWRTRWRRWGLAAIAAGAVWAATTAPPDLLVTGDGRHLAYRTADGRLALLRPRAGDYVRDMLNETSGLEDEAGAIDALREAQCSSDSCRLSVWRGGRAWRIFATRSSYYLPIGAMRAECAAADIVVSDRRLPGSCTPKWLKADRTMLEQTGGLAIRFIAPSVQTVRTPGDAHPWRKPTPRRQYRRNSPAKVP